MDGRVLHKTACRVSSCNYGAVHWNTLSCVLLHQFPGRYNAGCRARFLGNIDKFAKNSRKVSYALEAKDALV